MQRQGQAICNLPRSPIVVLVHCTMTIPRLHSTDRFDPASLFRPGSIAVIGADSENGARVRANLAMSGFTGRIDLAPDCDSLAQAPQLAVLAIPPDAVVPAMEVLA